ncbi:SUPPRESSOR OF GAMMA RESPONSE 1-like [Phalaenopsis equestris]|uniref:SUPPRESSOR OF GAMMA RESPONSE 1-like n=1 Tax=Phalaenopsis equestris TaxID=78828 RepID=UPI0009E278E4|nr:SUPPRESSOR OF GAMMA RESPONSE 1-like [Phalaenopsis equestris]
MQGNIENLVVQRIFLVTGCYHSSVTANAQVNHDPIDENNEVKCELENVADQNISAHHETEKHYNQGTAAQDSQSAVDPNWWEGESQFLLDSQQLAAGIAICDEFLLSQSSCASDEEKNGKPSLSVYAQIGVEDLKKDLEECQKLSCDAKCSNIELDTPPDMRLSQIEFGSQDSFMAWTGSKLD